jgi:hypothetical protein
MPNDENWVLPIKPTPMPPDIDAALARVERDRFLAMNAPGDRRMPSIVTGRGGDAEHGR